MSDPTNIQPAPEAPVTPAVEAAPAAVEPAAVVEAPVVEAPADSGLSAFPETLLEKVTKELAAETAPKSEAPTPVEAEKKPEAEAAPKVEGEQPKVEAAPVEEPAPLPPIEYKYEVPEGLELNDERKGEFHSALDAFRANPAEGIQPLLELHSKAVVEAINKVRSDQMELFKNTTEDWDKAILGDSEIGGNGHDTATRAVARVRDAGLKDMNEMQKADFEHFLRVTGAGSHPAFWRLLHNLAPFVDEPMRAPTNILPPKNIGKAPAGAKRQDSFYDHPRGSDQ